MDPYRELFERSADAILIIEGDEFIDCNAAAVRMLGHERREDVLRTHPSELSPPTQPDGRDSFEKANEVIARAFAQGSQRFEWEHLRADGEVFPVEVLLTAVPEKGRHVLHVVWRDISERKALEERLRHAQKMESIGKLAGGIAHDFNNLLVVIQGYANLIQQQHADDPELSEQVGHIVDAGDRAGNLVSQLLAFGRKQQMRLRVLDLNEIVRGNQALVKSLVGDHVEVVLELHEQGVPVKADASQVEQILMNLAANARDAMARSGRLRVVTDRVRLGARELGRTAGPLTPGDYALLEVADTGAGMGPEVAARAFDPFYTTKPVGQGTGLGLATVYGIVAQSGGSVELLSEPGEGTSVRILLPVAGDEQAPDERPADEPPATPRAPGGQTILVVEDEPAVSSLVVSSLQKLGYRTLQARDGAEALRAFARHQGGIDLILSDVVMPNLSGPEFVERLRADGHDPAVLFMSGYSSDVLELVNQAPGEIDLLEKPFRIEELARRVRGALSVR